MDPRGAVSPAGLNPYVGPRPFSREEKDKFFGREREGRDLLALVISERLVLFYAQSGAGKTSLINTRLVPGLEARGFEVLPIGRVSGELLPGVQVDNIFATNLMIKLDEGIDDPNRFRGLRLSAFLLNLSSDGEKFLYRPPAKGIPEEEPGEKPEEPQAADEAAPPPLPPSGYQIPPRILIIDQFEELFNTHPEAWQKREDFLEQLAEAMRKDPYLWVVLAMREDYIARLIPYASLLPGGLRVRYPMQRLSVEAALQAVTQPVAELRPFEPQAARELVENLSRISAGRDESGVERFVPGEFVEPVQLQVVCYQLWEDLKGLPGERITIDDLHRLARGQDLAIFVNRALADFYQESLQKVLRQAKTRVSEKKLRDWFENQLITEARTRGFVFMGETTTAGIPNEIVTLLEGQLVRSESRAGGKWYELVHDRFIDPILQSNQQWARAQQRRTRPVLFGVGLAGVLLILFLLNLSNTSNTQAQINADQATQSANRAQLIQDQINATLGPTAYSPVQTSRSDAINLYADLAQATGTIAALQLAATAQAAEVQLMALQAPANTTPTEPQVIAPLSTPTPTSRLQRSTPSATVDPYATSQAATAEALMAQMRDIQATQTELANPVRQPIIGQTAEGTNISALQLGTGTRNVVLVGGLHAGFAPATVMLADEVADYYATHLQEIPPKIKLHIISNANPDSPPMMGERDGRLNSNEVDLNRNWDCDWKRVAKWGSANVSGGSAPFSELETQALREYFTRTQPVAVIFWEARSAGGLAAPGGCGLQSLFSESLAQIYGSAAGYKIAQFEAYAVNGDATNWLDAQGIPAISVLLPDYNNPDIERNLQAVRALLESYR